MSKMVKKIDEEADVDELDPFSEGSDSDPE